MPPSDPHHPHLPPGAGNLAGYLDPGYLPLPSAVHLGSVSGYYEIISTGIPADRAYEVSLHVWRTWRMQAMLRMLSDIDEGRKELKRAAAAWRKAGRVPPWEVPEAP